MYHCWKIQAWRRHSRHRALSPALLSIQISIAPTKRCKWSRDRNMIGSQKGAQIYFIEVKTVLNIVQKKKHMLILALCCAPILQFKLQPVTSIKWLKRQTPNPQPKFTHYGHPALMLGVILWNKLCSFQSPIHPSHVPAWLSPVQRTASWTHVYMHQWRA